MELQWELIIFTTLVAWCAGLFASQCVLALKGGAAKAQMPAWIVSAALLVVGGVAVFFHLQHWERIFNGFGHLSSGITQELIAIVVLAVVAVIYLVLLRKGNGRVPSWIAVLGIIVSAVLVFVMAHSYMMAARPAWDSLLQILSLFGAALGMGPATMAAIEAWAASKEEPAGAPKLAGLLAVAGTAVNAVTTVAYVLGMNAAGAAYSQVGYYFDPVHPTAPMVDVAALSPFAGDSLLVTVVAIAAAVAAVACALVGKKQGKLVVWGVAAAVLAAVGAIALRVVFYQMGASIFLFY